MENKRIGIITFHTADNYGAVLQAYALQHYIETNISPDVEIINYNKAPDKRKTIFHGSTRSPLKNMVLNVMGLFHRKESRLRHQKFESFRKSYLHLTEPYIGEKSLENIEHKDIYITGSDQVFNPRLADYKAYYLNFDKHSSKKIAYAPSFGIATFNDEITKKILPLLNDFDTISCREKSGAYYLSQVLQKNIETVLDPVFLLSKEEWAKIATHPPIKQKYLLVYCLSLGKSSQIQKLAQKIALTENLQIITIGSSNPLNKNGKQEIVGPQDFLGYFLYADFILTDSFHGTSFSLIFGKRHLSYIANKNKGTRIENVMNVFGKSDEIIHDIEGYKYTPDNIKLVETTSTTEIQKSKQFLHDNLK